MTPATHTHPETEYRQVYAAICAIATRCDGALSDDGVGFNGQDTHFGRRIASVPFEDWTPEVRAEAARIAGRYATQAETYTGVDVRQLDVVREAQGRPTIHAARDQARGFERRARGAAKIEQRKAEVRPDGRVKVSWVKGDPDFSALLDAARALPGRRFVGDGWEADPPPRWPT